MFFLHSVKYCCLKINVFCSPRLCYEDNCCYSAITGDMLQLNIFVFIETFNRIPIFMIKCKIFLIIYYSTVTGQGDFLNICLLVVG